MFVIKHHLYADDSQYGSDKTCHKALINTLIHLLLLGDFPQTGLSV